MSQNLLKHQTVVLCRRGSRCRCPEITVRDNDVTIGEDGKGFTSMTHDEFVLMHDMFVSGQLDELVAAARDGAKK